MMKNIGTLEIASLGLPACSTHTLGNLSLLPAPPLSMLQTQGQLVPPAWCNTAQTLKRLTM
eukprot:9845195-Karenia_brevis.AAC.1